MPSQVATWVGIYLATHIILVVQSWHGIQSYTSHQLKLVLPPLPFHQFLHKEGKVLQSRDVRIFTRARTPACQTQRTVHVIYLSIAKVFRQIPVKTYFHLIVRTKSLEAHHAFSFHVRCKWFAITQIIRHILGIHSLRLVLSIRPWQRHDAITLGSYQSSLAQTVELQTQRGVHIKFLEPWLRHTDVQAIGKSHTTVWRLVFIYPTIIDVRVSLTVIKRPRIIKGRVPLQSSMLILLLAISISDRTRHSLVALEVICRIYLRVHISQVNIQDRLTWNPKSQTFSDGKEFAVTIRLETSRPRNGTTYLLDIHHSTGQVAIFHRRNTTYYFHRLDVICGNRAHVNTLISNVTIIFCRRRTDWRLRIRQWRILQVGIGRDRNTIYHKLSS